MNYLNKHKEYINEGILADSLPFDIVSTIVLHKTSLGNNPAIPDIYDVPFLAKIINNRFNDIKTKLKEIGSITHVNSNELHSALSELILKCKELEKPYRNKLEKICYNLVTELFSIPEETIVLNIALIENIDFSKTNILTDPVDDESFNLNSVSDGMKLKSEIYKRKLLNTICMGGSMDLTNSLLNLYENEILNINPELIKLYKEIILINEYLLFTKEDIGINEENKMLMGIVEVKLGNNEYKTTINSQGTIFPVLLTETIKGLFELFISHGLPKNRNMATSILNHTDYVKSEPWDMRLGTELWKLLSMSFNDINSKELPYLLKRIASLDIDKFNFLMKEVFAKTKKGKQIMAVLSKKAKDDIDYNHFVDKMDKMKTNNSLITDEYIHLNEF